MKFYHILFLFILPSKVYCQSFTTHLIDDFSSTSIHAADLNSDGWIDIVATSRTGTLVNWYENNGDGTFRTNFVSNKPGSGPRDVQIANLDNDDDMDVIVVSDLDSSAYWYENDGEENFTESTISSSLGNANSVVVTDMNNDNELDILTSSYGIFASNDLVNYLMNDGSENFTNNPIVDISNSLILDAYPANIYSNSLQDILIANTQTNAIRLFKHNANSTFTEQTEVATGVSGVTGLFAIDMDNDGDVDILSASQNDNTIRWHENISQVFTTHIIDNNLDEAYAVYAGDLDSDGFMDVAAAGVASGAVNVYINNSDDTFSLHRLNGNAADASDVFMADINNDGSLDVISASSTGVRWYENHTIFKSGFE